MLKKYSTVQNYGKLCKAVVPKLLLGCLGSTKFFQGWAEGSNVIPRIVLLTRLGVFNSLAQVSKASTGVEISADTSAVFPEP